MLENTFVHIPGIGPRLERHLWRNGLDTWQAVAVADALPLGPAKADAVRRASAESLARLADGDTAYFYRQLPSQEHWRMFPDFRHRVAYVDIETTGLGGDDQITTICLWDGQRLRHYVNGQNLADFRDDIRAYDLLVTYNGKSFDIPFIRHALAVPMEQAHIDLRYVLASLGYSGGLKGCERTLGLDRGDLADVDGYFAVLLWRDYARNGNARALDTLLAYNALDVLNLEVLMAMAYNLKTADTPFADARRLAVPTTPDLPFEPDLDTIARIQRARGWIG